MLDYISRFGPTYCDLPTVMSNIASLLRVSVVNIDRKHTQRIPIIFYVIQILTGASYFYAFQFSTIWFVFVRCRQTKDLIAASVVFSLQTCGITGVAKLFYIRLHIESMKDLVDEYLAYDALVEPGSRFNTNLLNALRHVKKRAVGFWVFITFNGVIYVFSSLVRPGRHFIEDLYVLYGLEPIIESPRYEIAYVIYAAGVFFANFSETNTSAFLITLTGYVEAQMLALSQELDNVWEDAVILAQDTGHVNEIYENHEKIVLNEYIRNLLKNIAKKHIIIIRLLTKVEGLFRKAMAIEFGFLTLGLIAELLGGLENTYLQLPYTLLQVAMNCFIGQRLIDAGLILSNSIYSCKWERFDKFNQKTVYLMLMNSQKPLTISVGGLTILSFSYLMTVLNSIYSAYTALRNRI